MLDYDVLILGGGIIGCSVAYELSKFSLNIALIEKEYEIADDVLYSYIPTFNNKNNNKDTKAIIEKFNVRRKKYNYTMINNADRSTETHYENFEVINIYDLALGYGEVAFDNGVNFKLDEIVIDIEKISNGYRVVTNKNKFTCKFVINTLPEANIEDSKNKEDYNIKCFVIDKSYKYDHNNIMDIMEKDHNRILIVPNLCGDLYVYFCSKLKSSSDEALNKIENVLLDLNENCVKGNFDVAHNSESIEIDDFKLEESYLKIRGKYYDDISKVTDISRKVCTIVTNSCNCKKKKDFHDKIREFYRYNYMSHDARNKLIKSDNKYGKFICTCCNVSEGEIIECIRRPLGARTMDGIRMRTGAMFGICGGSYCISKIAVILARETNKKLVDIVQHSSHSNILIGRIKEFNKV